MEQNKEFAWLEYEKRLNEIEKRLKRGAKGSNLPAPGVSVTTRDNHAEEINFLKAEVKQLENAKHEVARLKTEITSIINLKEAEISNLFAKNKELENENIVLRNKVSRLSFNASRETSSSRCEPVDNGEDNGIFSWLQKPLIVIGSK
jgi:hypothetical protein